MSWAQAKTVAEKIYTELRANHSPGFIRIVVRALDRLLNAEKKSEEKNDDDRSTKI